MKSLLITAMFFPVLGFGQAQTSTNIARDIPVNFTLNACGESMPVTGLLRSLSGYTITGNTVVHIRQQFKFTDLYGVSALGNEYSGSAKDAVSFSSIPVGLTLFNFSQTVRLKGSYQDIVVVLTGTALVVPSGAIVLSVGDISVSCKAAK